MQRFLMDSFAISALILIIALAGIVTHQLTPIARTTSNSVQGVDVTDVTSSQSSGILVRPITEKIVLENIDENSFLIKQATDNSGDFNLVEISNQNLERMTLSFTAVVSEQISNDLAINYVEEGIGQPILLPDRESLDTEITLEAGEKKVIGVRVTELEPINFIYNIDYELVIHSESS